ncbi:MAG: leucyl aminopeptidase [Candidatus Micrarchaeota archaeon]
MKFIAISKLKACKCDSIAFPFWQAEKGKKVSLPSWAKNSINANEFSGKAGEMALVRNAKIPLIPKVKKALLIGLGKKEKADAISIISNYANAFSALKSSFSNSIAFSLPILQGKHPVKISEQKLAGRICSQIIMANYSFDKYKEGREKKKEPKPEVERVEFVCKNAGACMQEIKRGEIFGEASNIARKIQNEPANIATPKYVSKIAQEISRKSGVKCKIFGKNQIKQNKMNAMLAVSSGSCNEPQLVVMEYRGKGKKGWDIAIVGKGVTFDSGGLSLKPTEYMDDMKYDKSGACAVIGAMSALKKLKIKKNIVGIAAFVENMPGGHAYKPGDIVTACNSKTIEVLNTDAEGRVVLADALAFACKKYSPSSVIDMATLTGSCVAALGDLAAGLLCNDHKICRQLADAGKECGERLWRLPSWDEYDEKVESKVADVKNIGEKGNAGTIAGYSFLKPFVDEKCKWAHIDIAGVADIKKPKYGLSTGGTGFGVRLILEYLSK